MYVNRKTYFLGIVLEKSFSRVGDSGLGSRETSDRHPKWRAGDIIQANVVQKFYGDRLTPLLTADSNLNIWSGLFPLSYRVPY